PQRSGKFRCLLQVRNVESRFLITANNAYYFARLFTRNPIQPDMPCNRIRVGKETASERIVYYDHCRCVRFVTIVEVSPFEQRNLHHAKITAGDCEILRRWLLSFRNRCVSFDEERHREVILTKRRHVDSSDGAESRHRL